MPVLCNILILNLLRGLIIELPVRLCFLVLLIISPEHTEPEHFCHGFVIGLIVDRCDDYIVTSNRESGMGRYDVVMEPIQAKNPGLKGSSRSPYSVYV